MARSHRMTPKRRAALRKAQLASARRRRGKGRGKLAAANRRNQRYQKAAGHLIGTAVVGAVAYGIYRGAPHVQKNIHQRARNNVKVRTAAIGMLKNEARMRAVARATERAAQRAASRHGRGRTSGPPRSSHPYVHATRRRFRSRR